ncbi:kinase [Marinobacteraceae bacterium S3BR75-40.1]
MTQDDRVKRSTLALAVIFTAILTVVVLEFYGLIRHTSDKSAFPVGEFKALYLEPGEELRISSKPSHLHAECQGGYLVIASDTDADMRGALVDYKNRAVACSAPAPKASQEGESRGE